MKKIVVLMLLLLSFLITQTGLANPRLDRAINFDFSRVKEIRIVETKFLDKDYNNYKTFPDSPQTVINILSNILAGKKINMYYDPQAKTVFNKKADPIVTLFNRPEVLDAVLTVNDYGHYIEFVDTYIEDYTDYQEVTVKTDDDKTIQVTVPIERSRMVKAHWEYPKHVAIQLELYDSSTGWLVAKYTDSLSSSWGYQAEEPIYLTKEIAADFVKNFTKLMRDSAGSSYKA